MNRNLPLILAGLLAIASHGHAQHHGAPVILMRQPGTAGDRAARRLNAQDLHGATRRGEEPLVLIGSARLATDSRDPALFVQLQSASLCGSAGCSTSIYLRHDRTWRKVLDSVSGPIRVMPQLHADMHDLLVGRNDRWIWDGHVYQDTIKAPPLDDLRHAILRHRAAMHHQTPT